MPLYLSKEETQYIQNNPIVTIGMMNDFPVFSYLQNSKAIGFEHDLLKLISSKTGLKFEKKINYWPFIYSEFKHKRIDMIASISLTSYRQDFTLYTTSYYDTPVILFTRDDFGLYNGIKNLKGKKLGVLRNMFYVAKLKRIPYLDLVDYDSKEQIVRDLVFGNIDALVLNYPSVQKIIKDKNYRNILKSHPLKLNRILIEDLRFGIRSDNPILHSIIQKTLDTIPKKSISALSNKWMLDNYKEPINYSIIFLLCIAIISVTLYILVKKRNKELSQLVVTDKLTNLYNRRKLEELIQKEIHRCERFKHTFTLAILDIDYFKDVNDTYGHLTGDRVLIEISSILKTELRKTDFVGRFGGEEFVIICTESNLKNISSIIESLRLKIANYDFSEVGQKTASFGLTMYKKDDSIDSIIKRADDALYRAKENGRNRIEVNL